MKKLILACLLAFSVTSVAKAEVVPQSVPWGMYAFAAAAAIIVLSHNEATKGCSTKYVKFNPEGTNLTQEKAVVTCK